MTYDNLPVGTVIIVNRGKTGQRWKITSPLTERDESCWYGARRWVKKNNRWSSNEYCIGPSRIVGIEDGA